MLKRITWAEIKELVDMMPPEILAQNATIWNESEETGHAVTAIKILDEDWHYDGDEGCAPIDVIKENYEDYEENKDDYYLVHRAGTPILMIPDSVMA